MRENDNTEAKHTPTPWKVSDGTDMTDVQSASGVNLALMMFRGRDHNGVEVEIDGNANADLIVRAVNSFEQNQQTIAALVEALEEARDFIREFKPEIPLASRLLPKLNAALAAAKGTK